MPTQARIKKVKQVLSNRYSDLRVVLEEVKNTHNASAVVRTCDAAGIQFLDVISAEQEPFSVNEAISTRAEKWLHMYHYTSTSECLLSIRNQGFKIAATTLSEKSVPYNEIDYSNPTAFVFGNEADGTSRTACDYADHLIHIPMKGMAQSLNLSVSVGIVLYEAIRQRNQNRSYQHAGLDDKTYMKFMEDWLGIYEKNEEG